MKKTLILCLAVLMGGVMLSGAEPVKKLKILSIGNSFSVSTRIEYPKIVESDPTSEMVLNVGGAMLGGCSLQRHWETHMKSEKDPKYTPYNRKKSTLREQLTLEKWDIVTLQQVSHLSWKKESFEPYLGDLIKLVRELAPTAEIVLQQTWSYNTCDPRFDPQNKYSWKKDGKPVDQTVMYELLTENYLYYAKKYNLRVIPTGYAVQLYRKAMGEKLFSKKLADFENPSEKSVMTNDVVARFYNWKNPKTGERSLRTDAIHLNGRGTYFQSLVWYAFMFGKDPEKITYCPKGVTAEEAALFKKLAKEAVANFPQVKK